MRRLRRNRCGYYVVSKKIVAMPDDENDVVEECTTWGMFIELRYIYPGLPIATDNERIAYDVYSFCGMIDSDGMGCLLSQPQSKRQLLFQSLLNLGLAEQVENATNAASALQNSGLSLEGNDDREATSKLLRPFEDRYYRDLREPTYN